MQLVFRFMPKVSSRVEVMALFRPPKFFHSNTGKLCLYKAGFVHRGIDMLEQVWTFTFKEKININCNACKWSGVGNFLTI